MPKISKIVLRHLAQNESFQNQWYDYEVQQIKNNPDLELFNNENIIEKEQALIEEALNWWSQAMNAYLNRSHLDFEETMSLLKDCLLDLSARQESNASRASLVQPLR